MLTAVKFYFMTWVLRWNDILAQLILFSFDLLWMEYILNKDKIKYS